jgi:hypothetical protein
MAAPWLQRRVEIRIAVLQTAPGTRYRAKVVDNPRLGLATDADRVAHNFAAGALDNSAPMVMRISETDRIEI